MLLYSQRTPAIGIRRRTTVPSAKSNDTPRSSVCGQTGNTPHTVAGLKLGGIMGVHAASRASGVGGRPWPWQHSRSTTSTFTVGAPMDTKKLEVDLACPHCGKKSKQQLGRLEQNPTIVCAHCHKPFSVDGASIRVLTKKVNQALTDLARQVTRLGKS